MKELQYLNKYFFKYKYHFLFGIAITIVAQFFMLFTPKLISEAFKVIEDCQNKKIPVALASSELIYKIIKIVFATIIAGFLTFLMRQTLIVMSRHVEFDLKNEVYNKYQQLDQNFYKRNRTGDLMSRKIGRAHV